MRTKANQMNTFLKTTLILFISYQAASGQNLVPNNSFEEFKKCPEMEAEFDKLVKKWECPNESTPDYFNTCSLNKLTNPNENFGGSQKPFNGDGYAAIILCKPRMGDYREYIQCKLLSPLKKNQLYCCSFYISLSDKSAAYTNKAGMYLSEDKIKEKNGLILNYKPQIENKAGRFLDNKTDWTLISDTMRAKGGEQYITIGNFYDGDNTPIKNVDNLSALKRKFPANHHYNFTVDAAYYYLDEVSVIEISDAGGCNFKQKAKESIPAVNETKTPIDIIAPPLDEQVILKNLVFETNKSEILSASYEELNKVADYLNTKSEYKIALSGYTDNIGKEEVNQKLSEARAKAVADYLINKGIVNNRISYKGYGSTKPLTANDTEAGRLMNRRVEFVIKEK